MADIWLNNPRTHLKCVDTLPCYLSLIIIR